MGVVADMRISDVGNGDGDPTTPPGAFAPALVLVGVPTTLTGVGDIICVSAPPAPPAPVPPALFPTALLRVLFCWLLWI